MQLDEKSRAVRVRFGGFLKDNRLQHEWGLYEVGYILRASNTSVWGWERGSFFPASIILLKKLALIYRQTPYVLKDIVAAADIRPSVREQDQFLKTVYSSPPLQYSCKKDLKCCYEAKDERDTEYKTAFGKYLRNERKLRGIQATCLAKGLGVKSAHIVRWESGGCFPRSIMTLAQLDLLFGDTFDVLFGLCQEKGIHLTFEEKRDVFERMKRYENLPMWSRKKRWLPVHAKIKRQRKKMLQTWLARFAGKGMEV